MSYEKDEHLLHEIHTIVNKNIDYIGELELDESLNSVGLNSLRLIAMIVDLEEKFDIEFADEEMLYENFSTMRTIFEQIKAKTT
ncbi:acyl carrier protein [Paenibacillus sp. FSL R5-0744]|uniref:acyl carrier protein n=1 Tax=Paenibacillus sp. FSL R5-0744 TaxID=2921656 RepID=UPI0030D9502A